MAKPAYTEAELQIGTKSNISWDSETAAHTHNVVFTRPLTRAEQHLFTSVLIGFYYTVHFSRQFGNSLVAEPVVEFISGDAARYTLRQTTLGGPWKELLFAILANFSHEVVSIRWHDESQAFDPEFTARHTDEAAVRAKSP